MEHAPNSIHIYPGLGWDFGGQHDEGVGAYELLRDTFIHLKVKPHWFHRLMTRLLLGWKWRDEE